MPMLDPPENMFEQEVDNSRKRKVGFSGFFQEKMVGADMAGDEKAVKRTKSAANKRDAECTSDAEEGTTSEKPKRKMTAKQRIESRRASRAAVSATRERVSEGPRPSPGKVKRKKRRVHENV